MAADLRIDPLTGAASLHVGDLGRPTPSWPVRTPPGGGGPCPLCRIRASHTRGHADEKILARRGLIQVVANAYPVLGTPGQGGYTGVSELTYGPVHADGLEHLDTVTARDLLGAAWDRAALAGTQYPSAGAFASIGAQAGASQEHLHVQILAGGLIPGSATERNTAHAARTAAGGGCALCADRADAETHQQGVTARAWVPRAPVTGYELRLAGTCAHPGTWADLAADVRALTKAWEATGNHWAYNLLLHTGPHPWAQLLPRTSHGIGYTHALGARVITGDQGAYAAELARLVPLVAG